jgi:acyl-CoA thioesterase I
MKRILRIFSLLCILFCTSCALRTIKVACIGDSITEGSGLACPSKTAYPVVLDSILGSRYDVLNSGRSATSLQKKGDFPYWICKEFSNVFVFQPKLITIKLGTNDTKPQNWNAERFLADYQALVDTLKTMKSNPRIYLCLPVPVYKTKWGINDSTVRVGVIPAIKKIAERNKLPLIDLYEPMAGQPEYFPDNIHPNEKGDKKIAEIIAKELKKKTN